MCILYTIDDSVKFMLAMSVNNTITFFLQILYDNLQLWNQKMKRTSNAETTLFRILDKAAEEHGWFLKSNYAALKIEVLVRQKPGAKSGESFTICTKYLIHNAMFIT